MKNQLFQVFKTYWARRSNVRLFCFLLIVLLVCYFFGRVKSFGIPIAPSLSFPIPHESLASGLQQLPQRVKSDKVRTLSLFIVDKLETPDLTSYTHVRRLNLSANALSEKLISDLPFLSKVRSLELKTPNIPVGMLASMGGNLEELSISSKVLREHANELHQMSALKLLIIDNTDWSREVFEAIATVPHLRYLVVQPVEFSRDPSKTASSESFQQTGLNPTAEALLALQNHSHLKGVFMHFDETLRDTQGNAVQLPIYPLETHDDPLNKFMGIFSLMVSVTIVVFSQLSTLMLRPNSMTTPGFIGPHLVVAASILSALVLILTLLLTFIGIAPLPSLSFVLLVVLFWMLLSPEGFLAKPREGRFDLYQIVLLFCRILVAATVFWIPLFIRHRSHPHLRAQFFQYLDGERSGLALILIVLEIAVIAIWFLRAKLRARMMMEASPQVTTMLLWSREFQEQIAMVYSQRKPSSGNSATLRRLQTQPQSFWKQVRLLRMGNQSVPIKQMLPVFLVFLVVFFGSNIAMQSGDDLKEIFQFDLSTGFNRFVVPTFFMNLLMILWAFAVMFWLQRAKNIELEVCRPMTRKNFVRALFAGLAIDHLPVLVVGVLLAVYGIFYPRNGGSVEESWWMATLILAVFFYMYTVSTLMFAFKNRLTAVVVGGVFSLVLMSVLTSIAILSETYPNLNLLQMNRPDAEMSLVTLLMMSLLVVSYAVAILIFSYRKTLQREWS